MQFVYDGGYLFFIPDPTKDQTPIFFGSLKSVQLTVAVEIGWDSVPLKYHVMPMFKKIRITGTAKHASIDARRLGPLFFSQGLTAGQTLMEPFQPAVIPSTGPYTIAAAVPVGGTFSKDLGVYNGTTGLPFQATTGAPAQGQYAQVAGVYTFNTADKGTAVQITYLYTVATGWNFDLNNGIKTPLPLFSMFLTNKAEGKIRTTQLVACASSKLIIMPQCEKYEQDSFDFESFAMKDETGLVGNFSTTE